MTDVELEERAAPPPRSDGVAARELLELRQHHGLLTANALEQWLLEQRLAELTAAGRLVPTQRAVELGQGLRFLG